MVDKKELLEKMLAYQKGLVDSNIDKISYNGRILDSGLMGNEEAKEYTQKKYKKSFDKKKEIDSKNEKRPKWYLSFIYHYALIYNEVMPPLTYN